MTPEQIKHMVDRFLSWKLPEHFNPDGGISFEKTLNKGTAYEHTNTPSGTNLIDATQADAMVRYMIEGLPAPLNDMSADNAPDWPPAETAIGQANGTRKHGSTGQLFEARDGRWERIRAPV